MRVAVRRLAVLIGCLAVGWAAPPLTTIQDVLYKADGTLFNGILLIEWKSFEASDSSNIATHNLAAPIVNGVLRVQLVPTTNASAGAYYSVKYNSDGKVQFEETWAVPPSATPLRLQDVRVAVPTSGGSTLPPGGATEIQESDVVGLLADLAVRPVKGPGYAPSRALYADMTGALEAVVGNLTDCVRVDGTAGPCGTEGTGTAGPGFVDGETPAGDVNGSNAVFTLADAPSPLTSLAVYRNGLLQQYGSDYTLDSNVITFAGGSIPQSGDTLLVNYRLADPGNPVGEAGGALMGTYPSPSLALGVVSDANVSDVAGIRESKLALNYPTHSNANDPTSDQKAALSGTSGSPSTTNRYVTDYDPRMTNARAPLGHTLLGTAHSDVSEGTPLRGDLVVAQGTSPTLWTRLSIGPANRCLMSNGFDAVWNTCLYTGFTAGVIPFVDASGNLAQNSARLVWDNANRKLSVGNSTSGTTLYVYDSLATTGSTVLTVRAGQGQSTDPLQRWLDTNGGELGRVEPDGRIVGTTFRGATSAARAAWQDAGNAADPSTVASGDAWYNSSEQTHKTVEAGQTHALSQAICSSTGIATSATGLTVLGSCTLPANLLKAGDRVEIRFDYSHEGSTVGFTAEVHWGGTTLFTRDGGPSDALLVGRADAGVHSGGAQLSVLSWGSTLMLQSTVASSSELLSAPLTIDFLGKMGATTGETVTLRNFTVVRIPAQANP